MSSLARAIDWRSHVWFAMLVAASIGLSTTFACATPLVAFGAAAALTLPSRDALRLIGVVWFTDQVFGYTVLHYPQTANSVAWGLIMGAAAVLATVAAQRALQRSEGRPKTVAAFAAFLVGFVVHQVALAVPAVMGLGGLGGFKPAVIARVFMVNAGTLVGLMVLNYLGRAVGLAAQSSTPFTRTRRPA
ncbi:MAG TPA: hypothetical protein VFN94_03715 [Nitrospiria bacterium]|nr:hypothetical protein [Nitrospiria bacterium]